MLFLSIISTDIQTIFLPLTPALQRICIQCAVCSTIFLGNTELSEFILHQHVSFLKGHKSFILFGVLMLSR